jgi:hypothetical protein
LKKIYFDEEDEYDDTVIREGNKAISKCPLCRK